MTLAESISQLVAQVAKIGGETGGLLQRIVDLEDEVSRLRKLVVPIRWTTFSPSFTNGTAANVNVSTYLQNSQNLTVTYSVVGTLPAGCTFAGSTLSYNGTGAVAASSVVFRAVTGAYTVDSASTSVVINAAPPVGNRAPVWTTVPTQAATQGTTYTAGLSGYASDPDGDALTFGRTGSASDTAPAAITVNSSGLLTVPNTVAAGAYDIEVYADDGYGSAANDWLLRSTAPGVVWAQLFESDADVNNYRFSSGLGWEPNPAPGSVGSYVRRDPTGGIFGRGCLELEQMANGNTNSYWCRPFNPAWTHYQMTGAGGDRGPGQPFYLQLRYKTNAPAGSSSSDAGRKAFSVSRTENSYTLQEIVAQNINRRGFYQMYQGMHRDNGAYGQIYTSVSGDFNLQPGSEYPTAPAFCSYNQYGAGNISNCLDWGGGEWITFYWYILPSTHQTSNGNITAWYWKPGMTGYKKVIDYPNAWMNYTDGLDFSFNAVLLWIYETNRASGAAGEKQWYDQVIYSTQPIACPTV